jgi:hypothetical protein
MEEFKVYKRILAFMVTLSILLAAYVAYAVSAPMDSKMKARHMIKRTALVIRAAHKQVAEHKVYTGDLARAVARQKFAKLLFQRGEYIRSMHQTKWARHLAVKAIIANKGQSPAEGKLSSEEEMQTTNGPSEEQLTKELNASMPSEPMKDEALINLKQNIDVE